MQNRKYRALSRILAFLAVSCAIFSVAWLIRDYTLLAIGIPGLAAGHYYSWRRPEALLMRSLILLLFVALTVYLGGDILRSGFSDRLLLSRYLIYGLVLGSFDLMRRRNVIASLVLGTLLMVLVSELALNFWFLAFLVPFIVLALISAITSHIELEAEQAEQVGRIGWPGIARVWLGLATGILLIAAIFFLLMPRVASSQVRQASWLPSRLDLTQAGPAILPSRPSAAVEPGIFPFTRNPDAASSGEYVPLGYTGSSADRVVMNVRSRISSYWRGLTLDEYDGRGWLNSTDGLGLRENDEGAFLLPDSRVNPQGERNYWQVYYMLTDQPNAIFTGYNPGTIYLPELEFGYLERGTLYRTLSAVPYLRPDPLRRDIAVSPDPFNLELPPITERTAALAESIVRDAPTDYDKAANLERFLIENYPYNLDIEPLPPGRDAVDYFLFEQQEGYCASFATAMAVMARHVGLPARVAAGYLPGYIDPLTGAHIVRAGDAHAWVEIYFQRHGWVAFDPTPRADAAMGFATGRNLVYFGLEDFTGTSLAEIFGPLTRNLSLSKLPTSVWIGGLAAVMALIVALLAIRFRKGKAAPVPERINYSLLDGESRRVFLKLYRKMTAILAKKGLPQRRPFQSPFEYAAIVCELVPDIETRVKKLTGLAIRAAYDPAPFEMPDDRELRLDLRAIRGASIINS